MDILGLCGKNLENASPVRIWSSRLSRNQRTLIRVRFEILKQTWEWIHSVWFIVPSTVQLSLSVEIRAKTSLRKMLRAIPSWPAVASEVAHRMKGFGGHSGFCLIKMP